MASEATDAPSSSSFTCDRLVLRCAGEPAAWEIEEGYKTGRFLALRKPGIAYMLLDYNYLFDPESNRIFQSAMISALSRDMPRQSQSTARYRFTRVENERCAASNATPLAVQSRDRPGPILILRFRGRVIVVDEASIEWIDGAGNYVRFHVGMEKHRVRGTMKDLEKVLPPQFVRSHRSTIINVAALHEFVRTPFGDLIAVLRSGARLTVGRTFRRSVEAAFAGRL